MTNVDDIMMVALNERRVHDVLQWMYKAIMKKVNRGLEFDYNKLVDSSVMRRLQQEVIRDYNKGQRTFGYPMVNFTNEEKREIRERLANEVVEWMEYDRAQKEKGESETISLSESKLSKLIMESLQQVLNEGESYGWVVDTDEVDTAYDMACDAFGREEINEAIVRCLGTEQLSECLAYIFRMYDFREWTEYKEGADSEE